jgi:hypothetical protein
MSNEGAVTETGISSKGRVARGLRVACLMSGLLLALSCGSSVTAVAGETWAGSHELHAHSAESTVPDLTGTWENIANAHGSPPWRLTASNGLKNLEAHWHGGPGYHENLVGEFHGTLSADGIHYEGRYSITEGDPLHPSTGTAKFTIQNANRIKLDIGAEGIVFVRLGAPPVPSPSPAPKVELVETPSALGQTVTAPAPPPGSAALTSSPALAGLGAVEAKVGGLSPNDTVFVATALAAVRAHVEQECFLMTTRILVKHIEDEAVKGKLELQSQIDKFSEEYGQKFLLFSAYCVAANYDREFERALNKDAMASAASSRCPVLPVALAARRSHGKTHLTSARIRRAKGVSVSCSTSGGAVKLRIASKSGKPLRKYLGSRLVLGVARGSSDPTGGQLSFSYHKG